MAIKLRRMVAHFKWFILIKLNVPSLSLGRTRDKLNLLKLHYYSAYDNQTCVNGDLSEKALLFIVTRPFNHKVLLDQVTN